LIPLDTASSAGFFAAVDVAAYQKWYIFLTLSDKPTKVAVPPK